MVVTELAPFWLLVHGGVLVIGLLAGGWSNWGGRVGAVLLVMSMLLLVWIIVRSVLAILELRRMVGGPIHGTSGRARARRCARADTLGGSRDRTTSSGGSDLTLDLIRPDDDRRRASGRGVRARRRLDRR